jgi:hypothetical protein
MAYSRLRDLPSVRHPSLVANPWFTTFLAGVSFVSRPNSYELFNFSWVFRVCVFPIWHQWGYFFFQADLTRGGLTKETQFKGLNLVSAPYKLCCWIDIVVGQVSKKSDCWVCDAMFWMLLRSDWCLSWKCWLSKLPWCVWLGFQQRRYHLLLSSTTTFVLRWNSCELVDF